MAALRVLLVCLHHDAASSHDRSRRGVDPHRPQRRLCDGDAPELGAALDAARATFSSAQPIMVARRHSVRFFGSRPAFFFFRVCISSSWIDLGTVGVGAGGPEAVSHNERQAAAKQAWTDGLGGIGMFLSGFVRRTRLAC